MQLTMDLIERAERGERDALDEIVRIYEPFHDALLASDAEASGDPNRAYNENWKTQIQMHMVEAILTKWRRQI